MSNKINKNKTTRSGIKDMWNAYLLDGAKWTSQENPVVKAFIEYYKRKKEAENDETR